MVLARRGLPSLSQEDIGSNLGILFPPAGVGTRINERRYGLNNFFKKRKISLKSRFYSGREKMKVQNYIERNIIQGNDLLVCFRYGTLYQGGEPFGHSSLVESLEGEKITLADPRGERKKVYLEYLVRAINKNQLNGQNIGGFWSISSSPTKTL